MIFSRSMKNDSLPTFGKIIAGFRAWDFASFLGSAMVCLWENSSHRRLCGNKRFSFPS